MHFLPRKLKGEQDQKEQLVLPVRKVLMELRVLKEPPDPQVLKALKVPPVLKELPDPQVL